MEETKGVKKCLEEKRSHRPLFPVLTSLRELAASSILCTTGLEVKRRADAAVGSCHNLRAPDVWAGTKERPFINVEHKARTMLCAVHGKMYWRMNGSIFRVLARPPCDRCPRDIGCAEERRKRVAQSQNNNLQIMR